MNTFYIYFKLSFTTYIFCLKIYVNDVVFLKKFQAKYVHNSNMREILWNVLSYIIKKIICSLNTIKSVGNRCLLLHLLDGI